MALSHFPARMSLVGRAGAAAGIARPAPEPAPAAGPGWKPRSLDTLCGVASRPALLQRLDTVGLLAPTAPLSFLVVKVEDLATLNREAGPRVGDAALREVASLVRAYTRATDSVGRLTGASFGVVLQGTGAVGAGAVAARLGHYLSQLYVDGHRVITTVAVATGKGINAEVLPAAAADAIESPG